ncbi:hypothetical protein Hanom_Chr14g01289251 [Helianthus anomalus]
MSKLETFNFASLSNPGTPAAVKLSSSKLRCQGEIFGLRKDWSKHTKKKSKLGQSQSITIS